MLSNIFYLRYGPIFKIEWYKHLGNSERLVKKNPWLIMTYFFKKSIIIFPKETI
jgi:hypothetical protein